MRKIKKPVAFSGSLAMFCTQLVAEKRNLGYHYFTEEYLMKNFDSFCLKYDCGNLLTKELTSAWLQSSNSQNPKTLAAKAVVLRQLGIFMVRNGHTAYIIPKNLYSRISSKYTPHIFTSKELIALFSEADNLKPDPHSPYRHLIIPLIFRILYGCGLRVSEAIHLRVRDVDLENSVLTILDSKFGKDRFVPMDITLKERCRTYSALLHRTSNPDDFFFQNRDGEYYLRQNVYMAFRKILWKCGISHGGKAHGPRVHDFRHTFAVHCLKRWVENGYEISSALPVLSTYLGHKTFEGTSRYLRLTAELYPTITAVVEAKFSNLIPGGHSHEAN
jgi:integrase/recombinase XerD